MSHQAIWFVDSLVEVLIDGAETGGAYDAATFTSPAGDGPPPHVHANESEAILVHEGEVTVYTTAGSQVLGAGQAAHAPRGDPHTAEVTSEGPARYTCISVPAGFVDFRAVGTPAERHEMPTLDGPPDIERLERIAAAHGIVFIGPSYTLADLDAGSRPDLGGEAPTASSGP